MPVPGVGSTGSPTATPTPTGPVYLTAFNTPDGSAHGTVGKCIGFTIVGNGVTFAPDASVKLGPMGTVPSTWIDATHVKVGSPETGGTCVFTTPFTAAGKWDVTLTQGGTTTVLPGAIDMAATQVFDAGTISSPTQRIWTRDVITAAGANTFEAPYDVDVYQVRVPDTSDGGYRGYAHANFFTMSGDDVGADGITPRMLLQNAGWKPGVYQQGGKAVMFPQSSSDVFYFIAQDVQGKGGAGADYDLALSYDELHTVGTTTTSCAFAPSIAPWPYHVPIAHESHMDPAGACTDSAYGNPVSAPGPELAFNVTIPPHQSLRVSGYDDQFASAFYLLPNAAACSPRPTGCLAASQHFGVSDTNVLVWDNDTDSAETYLLVADNYTAWMTSSDGSLLVNVELLDRK